MPEFPIVDKASCKAGCRRCESVCPILAQGGRE